MTGKRSVVVALLAMLICSVAVADAAVAVTPQERATFVRAVAHYQRTLASIKPAQVVAQMRAEQARMTPCVKQVKDLYSSDAASNGSVDVGEIIGLGVHDTAEQWYDSASLALDQAMPRNNPPSHEWLGELRLVNHIAFCAVIEKWGAVGFTRAHQPKVFALLMGEVSPSPAALIGKFAPTFASWGFPQKIATHLANELTASFARYAVLNEAAGKEFVGWLKQHGIYQLMPPAERKSFSYIY